LDNVSNSTVKNIFENGMIPKLIQKTGHHHSFDKLNVTIIDHNPKWDDKSRQERESFWIRKLKTVSPNGINEKK
jgi:hypothetical protein